MILRQFGTLMDLDAVVLVPSGILYGPVCYHTLVETYRQKQLSTLMFLANDLDT